MARSIRHPWRAAEHDQASAVGNYAVHSDPELRFGHPISTFDCARVSSIRVTSVP